MILASWYHTIMATLFAVLAILLMIVILLQRGRGVGLAGAFGGAGGGASAFGAKTGDVLTWVTIVGAVLLLAFTVVLNYVFVETGPGLTPAGATPTPSGMPTVPPGGSQPPAQSPGPGLPTGGGAWVPSPDADYWAVTYAFTRPASEDAPGEHRLDQGST